MSEFDREKSFFNRSVAKCDRPLTKAWYRLVGAAGQQMPTKCVPMNHCGANAPGWLSGGHPTVAQGIVMRKVCFHWKRGCCHWSRSVRVQNCGAFFVYELTATAGCSMRYCGDNRLGRG